MLSAALYVYTCRRLIDLSISNDCRYDQQLVTLRSMEEDIRSARERAGTWQEQLEGDLTGRIEREYSTLHGIVGTGLSDLTGTCALVRREAAGAVETLRLEMKVQLDATMRDLQVGVKSMSEEMSALLENERAERGANEHATLRAVSVLGGRMDEDGVRTKAEVVAVDRKGRATLERGLEAAGRGGVVAVESAERRLTLVMTSLLEEAGVAQGNALGSAVAALAGDITETHAEVLAELARVELAANAQAAAVGVEASQLLADSDDELRAALEATEQQLQSAQAEGFASGGELLQAEVNQRLAQHEEMKGLLESVKSQFEVACGTVAAEASHSLGQSCLELGERIEEGEESMQEYQEEAAAVLTARIATAELEMTARIATAELALREGLDAAAAKTEAVSAAYDAEGAERLREGVARTAELQAMEQQLDEEMQATRRQLEEDMAPKLAGNSTTHGRTA